jgi:drug/metabolite transporter (DMT)-like permease
VLKLKHGHAVALMVLVTALWSIAGVVTRHLDQVRGFEVTFWRSAFTALGLLLIMSFWRGIGFWKSLPWRSPYFWLSGLCWGCMFTAFMMALTLTAVANVLITLACGPLLTALGAWLFIAHRLPKRTWLAIAFAGMGIALIFTTQLQLGEPNFLLGICVAMFVPLAGATQWTLIQKSQSIGLTLDLVPSVFIGASLSSLVTLPLALPLQANAHDIGLLAFLGVFQLAIPCSLSVICARVLKAPEVSLLALLEVIFGIALAWIWANEEPHFSVLIGGSMVLAALFANEWFGWRQRNVESQ